MAAEEPVVATPPPAEAAAAAAAPPKVEEAEAVVAEAEKGAATEEVAPVAPTEATETTAEGEKKEEEKPAKPAKVVKPKPTKEEIEKKALEEFKLKVEEAIKANEFVLPPPPPPPKEEAKPEEAKPEESKAEEEVKKDDPAPEEKKDESPAPAVENAPKAEVPESKPVEEKKEEPAPVAEAPKEEAPAATEAVSEEKSEEKPTEEEPAPPAEDVFLWGIPLLHTANDERTDVILNKFLRARDFKVSQALAMLKSTVLWRKSYKADEILEEDLGNDFDGLAYMFGEDKSGHPVCYNAFGALQDKELQTKVWGTDASKFLRWRVQLQEKGIKLLDFKPESPNALLQVMDFKNAPWPAKKAFLLGNAISLLQDNYPELVTKTVFINVPWIYSALLAILSPILTQHQKNKFVISRQGTEALFKHISPEKVPIKYGGLGRANDEEFAGAEAPVTEETIKPGEKKAIEVAVTTSGATVTWDLVVVGYDVSYGAEFQPEQEGGYTTIIEKTRKIATQLEEPIRNSFKTSEAGKVVLTIDNSLSRKKKVAVYRYIVKGSSSVTEESTPAPASTEEAAAPPAPAVQATEELAA